jgi:hypothetical protein
MNSLELYSPSTLIELLLTNENSLKMKEDIVVGKNKDVTLTIANGKSLHFRDIIVWGHLKIQAKNLKDAANAPILCFRNCFIGGCFRVECIQLIGTSITRFSSLEEFKTAIQINFLLWRELQAETVDKIGLKSIFFRAIPQALF